MSWTESVLHVDMDAFFVEVERLRRSELAGRPVVVGGDGPRGVVAAASYEARMFGVTSALPMARARSLCPELVIVPADHDAYREASERIFEIFRGFTPLVEGLSVDEAFLDISGLRRHYSGPVEVAEAVRRRIRHEVSLPSSVGIASNKFLAKLASQMAKPDGIRHVPIDRQTEFLHALPVTSLWGVGAATRAALEGLGVETVGDVAALPPAMLERRLGSAHGRHLSQLASGFDPRRVEPDTGAKSLSTEQTYAIDLVGQELVYAELLAHSDRLASRLRRAGLVARTVFIKIRYADFATVTRSETRSTATDVGRDIHHSARRLVEKVDLTRPIRLVGVGAGGLAPADGPHQLVVDEGDDWQRVADAVESVRRRFGDASIEPAALLNRPDSPR